MKIDIDRLGLTGVQVDPETVFTFPQGLAGFEASKHFKIFHEEGKPTVFWLQSLEDATLMFPIVAPELLDLEYQIELSDADVDELRLKTPEDAAVVIMVYRGDSPDGAFSANTRSPLILNTQTRLGMQKILQEVQPTLLYRAR